MKESDITVGVDIGGTNTVIGVVDSNGRCLRRLSFSTTEQKSAKEFIARLSSSITDVCQRTSGEQTLRGIGIAAPAARYKEGTILSPANLKWGTFNIVAMLKQHFTIPIAVTNDSNAAALGEMQYGASQGMKNFVVITLGTGFGAGIVVDGHLVYGENGVAGELGHMTVDPHGRMCGCNRRGCVETYVSAPGLCRTVLELLARSTDNSELRGLSYTMLSAEKIHELALRGDRVARKAFDVTGELLGRVLSNTVAVFDPQAIILSGGLVRAGKFLLDPAIKSFNENLLDLERGKVSILKSRLANGEGAILGASLLVSDGVSAGQKSALKNSETFSGKVTLEGDI